MNSAWPSIQAPSYPLAITPEDAVIRTEFDAGYQQTRPRFTRNRKTWGLKWTAMPEADWVTLLNFFVSTLANGAGITDWTIPGTSSVYAVRFTKPPVASVVAPNIYQVEVEIREV